MATVVPPELLFGPTLTTIGTVPPDAALSGTMTVIRSVPDTYPGREPTFWISAGWSPMVTLTCCTGVFTALSSCGMINPVTPGGIVGRVVTLSPWTAQVMLITDERAAAGAVVGQLGQSNALGSVKGLGNNGLLEMRYVSGLEEVNPGDYVVTTGQDGIYPPGLNVGEVVELKPGSATQPHEIKVKPSARLNALEEVAVLLYHPPPRTAPTVTLPNMDKGKKP